MFSCSCGHHCVSELNECSDPALNTCSQTCTNTVGSFTCSCLDGYQLAGNVCQGRTTATGFYILCTILLQVFAAVLNFMSLLKCLLKGSTQLASYVCFHLNNPFHKIAYEFMAILL